MRLAKRVVRRLDRESRSRVDQAYDPWISRPGAAVLLAVLVVGLVIASLTVNS